MLSVVTSVALVAVAVQILTQSPKQREEAMQSKFAIFTAIVGAAHGLEAMLTVLGFDPLRVSSMVSFMTAVASVGLWVSLHADLGFVGSLKLIRKEPVQPVPVIDAESPASPTGAAHEPPIAPSAVGLVKVEANSVEEPNPQDAPMPLFLLDSSAHLRMLRSGRAKRLTSINEEVCSDTPKWMAYLGAHVATELLPRVPLGGKQHSWDNVCETMASLAAWLRSDEAEELSKAYRPCFGFSCERCCNAVKPEESQCRVCSLSVD